MSHKTASHFSWASTTIRFSSTISHLSEIYMNMFAVWQIYLENKPYSMFIMLYTVCAKLIWHLLPGRRSSVYYQHWDRRIRWVHPRFRGVCSQTAWFSKLQTRSCCRNPVFHCVQGLISQVRGNTWFCFVFFLDMSAFKSLFFIFCLEKGAC